MKFTLTALLIACMNMYSQTLIFKNIKADTITANSINLPILRSSTGVSTVNWDYPYIKSCERFYTLFKVERNGKSYYPNFLVIIRNEVVEFTDYKRNGELRGSYRFPLTECKIYKSN